MIEKILSAGFRSFRVHLVLEESKGRGERSGSLLLAAVFIPRKVEIRVENLELREPSRAPDPMLSKAWRTKISMAVDRCAVRTYIVYSFIRGL